MSAVIAERALEPAERWFAVWTRSQCEAKVEELLRRKQFELFLPSVRAPSRRRDRYVVLERPLFPGYLFLRFAPSRETYISIASTDGVVRILGERWDTLHPVPDEQVEAVRRIVTYASRARTVPASITCARPGKTLGSELSWLCCHDGGFGRRSRTRSRGRPASGTDRGGRPDGL